LIQKAREKEIDPKYRAKTIKNPVKMLDLIELNRI